MKWWIDVGLVKQSLPFVHSGKNQKIAEEEEGFRSSTWKHPKITFLPPVFSNNFTMARNLGKSNQFCPFKSWLFFGMSHRIFEQTILEFWDEVWKFNNFLIDFSFDLDFSEILEILLFNRSKLVFIYFGEFYRLIGRFHLKPLILIYFL